MVTQETTARQEQAPIPRHGFQIAWSEGHDQFIVTRPTGDEMVTTFDRRGDANHRVDAMLLAEARLNAPDRPRSEPFQLPHADAADAFLRDAWCFYDCTPAYVLECAAGPVNVWLETLDALALPTSAGDALKALANTWYREAPVTQPRLLCPCRALVLPGRECCFCEVDRDGEPVEAHEPLTPAAEVVAAVRSGRREVQVAA